jgi:hypothetical protein
MLTLPQVRVRVSVFLGFVMGLELGLDLGLGLVFSIDRGHGGVNSRC